MNINLKTLKNELSIMKGAGSNDDVTITTSATNDTTFEFHNSDYFQKSVYKITVPGGGAGVIYVETTNAGRYPHITIDDLGAMHYTKAVSDRVFDNTLWPADVQRFANQYKIT